VNALTVEDGLIDYQIAWNRRDTGGQKVASPTVEGGVNRFTASFVDTLITETGIAIADHVEIASVGRQDRLEMEIGAKLDQGSRHGENLHGACWDERRVGIVKEDRLTGAQINDAAARDGLRVWQPGHGGFKASLKRWTRVDFDGRDKDRNKKRGERARNDYSWRVQMCPP
jgi:hypothetical protein